jgi:F0F1-type ATP synthase assembly protein I
METRQQGSTLFSAVLVLIATLVVIQLWLLSTAVDALLGRQTDVQLPTMVGSALLFLLAAGLLWFVVSFDNRLRQWSSRDR